MKISASMDYGANVGLSYPETARIMKQAGFDGIDLALCHNQSDPNNILTDEWTKEAFHMAEAAKDAGLELAQCHLPYYPGHLDLPGDGTPEYFESHMLPAYEHALEVCGRVGCHMAVMHLFTVLNDDEATLRGNVELIKKLLPLLEKYDIRIALENVFCRRNGQYLTGFVGFAENLLAVADGTGSQRIGVCIDTGHANIFRINTADMARTCGKRLFALHVNSNAGHDEHAVPYSIAGWCEKQDFEAFSGALKEIAYSGWYNLELNGGRFPAPVARPFYEYIAGVARYLADLC